MDEECTVILPVYFSGEIRMIDENIKKLMQKDFSEIRKIAVDLRYSNRLIDFRHIRIKFEPISKLFIFSIDLNCKYPTDNFRIVFYKYYEKNIYLEYLTSDEESDNKHFTIKETIFSILENYAKDKIKTYNTFLSKLEEVRQEN